MHSLVETEKVLLQNGDRGFASAPSNIALLKYWGKRESLLQIPDNSSLSLTLGSFRSTTTLEIRGRLFPKEDASEISKFSTLMSLGGEDYVSAPPKISELLRQMFLFAGQDIGFRITTSNNFPTACGIASSASGMAALVGAAANLLQLQKHFEPEDLQYWLYEWSRIGSGSATRSAVLGDAAFVAWECLGENETRTFAVDSDVGQRLSHCVVIIDASHKKVSSSDGHKLAKTSVLHSIRVAGAEEKFQNLCAAIRSFDFSALAQITEEDALAMHAVMQSGSMPLCYLTTESAACVATLLENRKAMGLRAFWTADAGANIHLLYLKEDIQKIDNLVSRMEERLGRKLHVLKNSSHQGLCLGEGKNSAL